jgi:Serine acetyltransferase, N-terminal
VNHLTLLATYISAYLSHSCVWSLLLQDSEPGLGSFLYSSVLAHSSMEKMVAFVLANKLASTTLLATALMRIMLDAFRDDPVSRCQVNAMMFEGLN